MEDWQERLMGYAKNRTAGQDEYKRALEVYRGKSAAGDTAGADAAKKWSDQVNTAIGGIGNSNQAKSADYMDRYAGALAQKPAAVAAPKPFQYDVSTDPAYQAALRQAQVGAQKAQNNAMVGLGSRGIGNSSVAVDRANQIQQSAIGNVNDTVLPELMRQAYTRYQNENDMNFKIDQENYGRNNDYMKNLGGLSDAYGKLGQQEIDNNRTAELDAAKKRQEHIDLADYLTKTYGVHVDPKDDPYYAYKQVEGLTPMAAREYNDKRADTKFEQDYKTRSLDSTIADRNADNARLNASPSSSVTKQQQAAVKAQETQKKKMDDEKQGLIAAVTDPENPMQYSAAKKKIEDDLRVGFYTQEEAAELLATLEKWANSAYATRYQ